VESGSGEGLSVTHVDNAIKALNALKYVLQNPSETKMGRFAKKRVTGTRLSDDKTALIVPLSGVFGIQAPGLNEVTFALTVREPDGDFSDSEGGEKEGDEEPSDAEDGDYDPEEPSSDAEDGGDKDESGKAADGDESDGGGKQVKKSTPVSEARGVFQSRQVAELIMAAGPRLHELNRELNELVKEHRLGRKRRRTTLHEMPAVDDMSGAARQQTARVAQQAAGAIWSLVRASVGQTGQDGEGAALLSIANKLRGEPRTLFSLSPVDEVFKKVLGDPATAIRVCTMCRTVGCLACRVTANVTAPAAPPASSDA